MAPFTFLILEEYNLCECRHNFTGNGWINLSFSFCRSDRPVFACNLCERFFPAIKRVSAGSFFKRDLRVSAGQQKEGM